MPAIAVFSQQRVQQTFTNQLYHLGHQAPQQIALNIGPGARLSCM